MLYEEPKSPLQMLRAKVREYLLEDMQLKLLAVLITFFIWFSVAGQTKQSEPITIRNVDVSLDNTPPGLAITSNDPGQISFRVKGPEDLLRELRIATATRSSDLMAHADLTSEQEGIRLVRLTIQGLPDGLTVQDIDPPVVRVTLEPLISKQVPVEPTFAGSPPFGYKFTGAQAVPEVVTLVGPASFLNAVEKATTTTVSLTNRTAPFVEIVQIDITAPDVTVREAVSIRVQIEEDIGSKTITIPILVPETAGGVVDPGTVDVTITGPIVALRQINEANVSATIAPDVAGGRQSLTPFVAISGPIASRVQVARVTPERVKWRK